MLVTAAQMREIETRQIDAGAVTGDALMERAGQAVVTEIAARWPELVAADVPVAVFCGPGNNGGDGFVVGRFLAARGCRVTAYLLGDAASLQGDALHNYRRFAENGTVKDVSTEPPQEAAALVIDALFGTGLTRPLEANPIAAHLRATGTGGRPRIVAVDMPSGLSSDTGYVVGGDSGCVVPADLTVTFEFAKLGHFLGEGPGYCGALAVHPIGLSHADLPADLCALVTPEGAPWRDRLGKAASGAHKFSHGHALVLSGSAGRSGAARLTARAALRAGAGLVTLAVPPAAQFEVAAQITALMLTRVADETALRDVLEDDRLSALALGPGFGTGAREAALLEVALGSGRALVLDADALTLLAQDRDLLDRLPPDCILTPHGGEFARLFPEIAADCAPKGLLSKVEATRHAAAEAGCVVLFKGHDTVIASPDGTCALHGASYERAAPWLATAGAGDVLTGVITGLRARGIEAMGAAQAGAWLHAAAARRYGPGLIAEDLPESLPRVFADLGL